MSLKAFHLAFILLCIVGAELVGAWALRAHSQTGALAMLLIGLVTLVGGLGLAGYSEHIARILERIQGARPR